MLCEVLVFYRYLNSPAWGRSRACGGCEYWVVSSVGGVVVCDLFRSPAQTLRRELDYLKGRLKVERAEARALEERLGRDRSEGLVKLLDLVLADVDRTAELVSEYKKALRSVGGD